MAASGASALSQQHDFTEGLNDKEREAFQILQTLVRSGRLPPQVDLTGAPVASAAAGSSKDKNAKQQEQDVVLTEQDIKFIDQACILRYLRARNFHVPKSARMLRESVEWRNSQGVYKLSITTHPFIETSLARANMYMNGRDKGGRPIIVLRPNIYHDPHSSEEKLFFMCYALEQAFRTMEPHIYQMTWVCSLDGYSMKHNGDLKFARELLNMLQNHNPERLGQAFFLDVPFLFRAAWKAMSPFIDEKTKSKVHFVANSNRTEYLAKYIDLDVLEACFGGTNRFQIDHHQYVKKMLDLEGVDHSTFKSTFGTEAPPKPRYSKTATNDIDPAEAAAARANLEKDAPDAAAEAEADAAAASAE